jgi:SSS family solute:Na+ symporter
MYLGVLIAVFYIGSRMEGGWGAVNEFYMTQATGPAGGAGEWWLSLFGNGDTWKIYIIGTVLSGLFYVAIGPQSTQINASAKNVKAIKRSILIAIPINTIFGLCMLAFGMASQATMVTNPAVAEQIGAGLAAGGPPSATFQFLVATLPNWLLIWIFAAFAAAMLSTMAIQLLAMATIIMKDIHIKYFNPNMTDKKETLYTRIWILAIAVVGASFATLLPPVQNAMTWLFSLLVPAFWLFVIGMFWKRSGTAAFITMILAAVGSTIWTFTQPLGFSNSVVVIIIGIVGGILFTALDKNAKPGLIKVYKQDRNSIVAEDLRS